jgi:hypothetical protein
LQGKIDYRKGIRPMISTELMVIIDFMLERDPDVRPTALQVFFCFLENKI